MQSSNDLDGLKRELETWRSSKNRGRFIPEGIWQRAATLTHTIGVTKVHQELRLGFTALKKRMDDSKTGLSKAKPCKARTSFVRLPIPSSSKIEDCVLKIESVSGARMQAELSGIETAGLSQLLREFASV